MIWTWKMPFSSDMESYLLVRCARFSLQSMCLNHLSNKCYWYCCYQCRRLHNFQRNECDPSETHQLNTMKWMKRCATARNTHTHAHTYRVQRTHILPAGVRFFVVRCFFVYFSFTVFLSLLLYFSLCPPLPLP